MYSDKVQAKSGNVSTYITERKRVGEDQMILIHLYRVDSFNDNHFDIIQIIHLVSVPTYKKLFL